jgi:hypothetical protein
MCLQNKFVTREGGDNSVILIVRQLKRNFFPACGLEFSAAKSSFVWMFYTDAEKAGVVAGFFVEVVLSSGDETQIAAAIVASVAVFVVNNLARFGVGYEAGKRNVTIRIFSDEDDGAAISGHMHTQNAVIIFSVRLFRIKVKNSVINVGVKFDDLAAGFEYHIIDFAIFHKNSPQVEAIPMHRDLRCGSD